MRNRRRTPPPPTPEPSPIPPAPTGTPVPPPSDTKVAIDRNLKKTEFTPLPERVPTPQGAVSNEDVELVIDPKEIPGKWGGRFTRLARSSWNVCKSRAIQFKDLGTGLFSVSAPTLSKGTRRKFINDYGFKPGAYKPSTIGSINARELIKGTFRKVPLGLAFVTSLAANIWDYGFGRKREEKFPTQEFFVSTGIDYTITVGSGLAATGLVSLGIAGLAALGVTAVATAPVALVLGIAAALGLGIGFALDSTGAGKILKQKVNEGIDAWGGVGANYRVIEDVVSRKIYNNFMMPTAEAINIKVIQPIKEIGERVANGISEVASDIKDSVSSFLSGIFGSGK